MSFRLFHTIFFFKLSCSTEVQDLELRSPAAALFSLHRIHSYMQDQLPSSQYNYLTALQNIIMNGRSHGRRRRIQGSRSETQPTCRHFSRFGTCKYGADCKFKHAAPEANGSSRKPKAPIAMALQNQNFLVWKKLLQQGNKKARPDFETASKFFCLSLQIIDDDAVVMQETIRQLGSKNGAAYARDIVTEHMKKLEDLDSHVRVWNCLIKPLFQLVTHEKVIAASVVRGYHQTFIQDFGASIITDIMAFTAKLLEAWDKVSSDYAQMSRYEMISLSFFALTMILEQDCGGIMPELLHDSTKAISRMLSAKSAGQDEHHRLQAAQLLPNIWRQLKMDDPELRLLAALCLPHSNEQQLSTIFSDEHGPGELSKSGPRHGNDHAHIQDIHMMPEFDEIISRHLEYLPTNNPLTWHKTGIQGRLDREFRLLREDTIGQLRDAIKCELHKIQGGNQHDDCANGNQIRSFTYHQSQIIGAGFTYKDGLELKIKFPQLCSKSRLQDRRDWWSQTKRLVQGSIVCAADTDGSLLFFTVAQSTVRTGDDFIGSQGRLDLLKSDPGDKHHSGRGEGNHNPRESLSDMRDFSYVSLAMIDTNKDQVDLAIQWVLQRSCSSSRVLIEFPGVLLAGFQHTLAALQKMAIASDTPFKDYLAPENHVSVVTEPSPPQYALRKDFRFNLKSITSDGEDLFYSPTCADGAVDTSRLEFLDPTQRVALLTTLRRGLSLIQGPPGTGKSYTGEKIIRVLLDNKTSANIGPVSTLTTILNSCRF
jgi:hypothetical protein